MNIRQVLKHDGLTIQMVGWFKLLGEYANDKGGTLFVGVSNDGEAYGIVSETQLIKQNC